MCRGAGRQCTSFVDNDMHLQHENTSFMDKGLVLQFLRFAINEYIVHTYITT